MQELQDKITEVLAATISSGELDEMIRKKLTATVDDILDKLLRSWSPLGKALEEKLGQALSVDLDLGLGRYNELVASIVKQRVDEAIQAEWKVKLEKQLDEILRGAPATIKLSEMLAKLAADHDHEARQEEWSHATMLVEGAGSYGSRWVYFDEQPRDADQKYLFSWQLLINDEGELHSARQRGETANSSRSRDLFESHYGFEGLLFKLKAAGTRVEFDVRAGLHEHEYEHEECNC